MTYAVLSAEMRTTSSPITPDEREQFSASLAEITIEVQDLESAKAAEMKKRNDEIKGRQREAMKFAGYIDSGLIERSVRCEWRAIDGLAVLVRTDTGEQIETRPLTMFEQERAEVVYDEVVNEEHGYTILEPRTEFRALPAPEHEDAEFTTEEEGPTNG